MNIAVGGSRLEAAPTELCAIWRLHSYKDGAPTEQIFIRATVVRTG